MLYRKYKKIVFLVGRSYGYPSVKKILTYNDLSNIDTLIIFEISWKKLVFVFLRVLHFKVLCVKKHGFKVWPKNSTQRKKGDVQFKKIVDSIFIASENRNFARKKVISKKWDYLIFYATNVYLIHHFLGWTGRFFIKRPYWMGKKTNSWEKTKCTC